MPTIKFDLRIPENAKPNEIADALVKASRELEWLLNGQLDNENLVGNLNVQSITIDSGTPFNTVTINNSTATTVDDLRTDFNALLAVLRQSNILNG